MAFEQLKDRIRESPISTVISHYIPLTKKGSALVALCPFHSDTRPSMNVNDNKGMFKCFACGQGGDAISFVKEYKKLEFIDALKEIASILNLPFEEYQKEKKKNPRMEMAFRVLDAATRLYQKVAQTGPTPYTEFLSQRQLNEESIQRFEIGFSPSYNGLIKYLETIPPEQRDFAQKTALDIGIVRYHQERQSYYDFYRDRIMFPIHDHQGKVRGFSSRAVLPNQNPKYLNSGESFIFEKNTILFGFCFARIPIRQLDQVIVVEGNMDVIMMHQFGFHQTVGTMGVALSEASIRLLSNMTKNIYLGMDSDEAGKKAMLKINHGFMALGILPKVLDFSPAKDPDEFLLTQGRLSLVERIEKAPVLLDKLIEEITAQGPSETIDQKLQSLHRIFDLLSPLREHLSAIERIIAAAKALRMNADSSTILEDYRDFLSRQKVPTPLSVTKSKTEIVEIELEKIQQGTPPNEDEEADNMQEAGPVPKSEKLFLKEIVCHPEFLTQSNRDEFLAYIGHPEVKRLFQWLVKIYFEIDEAEYIPIVQDELRNGNYSKEVSDLVTEALFNFGNKYNDKVIQRMLKDYKLILKMDQLKTRRKVLVERQMVSQTQNEVDDLLIEITKLDREIHSLKNSVP
jgi:DNA primase